MPSASALLHSAARRQLDHYHDVFARLEDAFNAYEAGQISIRGYAEIIAELEQGVELQRAAWLWLCDWSVVLRWINRAERAAYRDTLAALDWCREWALQQRSAQVAACIERARNEGAEHAAAVAAAEYASDADWSMAA